MDFKKHCSSVESVPKTFYSLHMDHLGVATLNIPQNNHDVRTFPRIPVQSKISHSPTIGDPEILFHPRKSVKNLGLHQILNQDNVFPSKAKPLDPSRKDIGIQPSPKIPNVVTPQDLILISEIQNLVSSPAHQGKIVCEKDVIFEL